MKYLDNRNKNIICIEEKSTPDFWDSIWDLNDERIKDSSRLKKNFVSIITKKYLNPDDGFILEGGCGNAENMAILVNNGFKCIGVDYAERIVQRTNKLLPNLDVRYANVGKLPFKDNYFTGYWSLGVIEHNINGYDAIAKEIFRVLKKNGYLFLTFPYMSPLRRFKSFFKQYKKIQGNNLEGFYQYILNAKEVENYFNNYGFKTIKRVPFDGIKGIKDEITFLNPVLRKIYSKRNSNFFIKGIKKILNFFFTPFGSHCILIIFQK